MYQPTQSNLDARIDDFIARKTAPKNLSQLIVDYLAQGQDTTGPKRGLGYEVLPLRKRLSSGS